MPIPNCGPTQHTTLRRIVVRAPKHSHVCEYMGTRNRENLLLTQYRWSDGTLLVSSSTSQLRLLQVRNRIDTHSTLAKWERQLGRRDLAEVWQATWLKYRLAAKNIFLWQFVYHVPATNRWRLPDRPASYPATWCQKCRLNVPKDVYHCIWDCLNSKECWQWCASILAWVSQGQHRGCRLLSSHVLIAESIPDEWDTPDRLWYTMRAIHHMLDYLEG